MTMTKQHSTSTISFANQQQFQGCHREETNHCRSFLAFTLANFSTSSYTYSAICALHVRLKSWINHQRCAEKTSAPRRNSNRKRC